MKTVPELMAEDNDKILPTEGETMLTKENIEEFMPDIWSGIHDKGKADCPACHKKGSVRVTGGQYHWALECVECGFLFDED